MLLRKPVNSVSRAKQSICQENERKEWQRQRQSYDAQTRIRRPGSSSIAGQNLFLL